MGEEFSESAKSLGIKYTDMKKFKDQDPNGEKLVKGGNKEGYFDEKDKKTDKDGNEYYDEKSLKAMDSSKEEVIDQKKGIEVEEKEVKKALKKKSRKALKEEEDDVDVDVDVDVDREDDDEEDEGEKAMHRKIKALKRKAIRKSMDFSKEEEREERPRQESYTLPSQSQETVLPAHEQIEAESSAFVERVTKQAKSMGVDLEELGEAFSIKMPVVEKIEKSLSREERKESYESTEDITSILEGEELVVESHQKSLAKTERVVGTILGVMGKEIQALRDRIEEVDRQPVKPKSMKKSIDYSERKQAEGTLSFSRDFQKVEAYADQIWTKNPTNPELSQGLIALSSSKSLTPRLKKAIETEFEVTIEA